MRHPSDSDITETLFYEIIHEERHGSCHRIFDEVKRNPLEEASYPLGPPNKLKSRSDTVPPHR